MAYIHYRNKEYNISIDLLTNASEIEPNNDFVMVCIFEIYAIQDQWQKIKEFTMPETLNKATLIGRAIGEIIKSNEIERFPLLKKSVAFIQEHYPNDVTKFITALSIKLYLQDDKNLLMDLITELEAEKTADTFLIKIIELWNYLLYPEKNDIAKLHPDTRMVVHAIQHHDKIQWLLSTNYITKR